MSVHDQNYKLMSEIFRADAKRKAQTHECHSCGKYNSHVVEMFNPDDPEARGEYGPCCITQKRKDGWRAI